MSTPLFSAVEKYVDKGAARFHVPGHKGKGILSDFGGTARYDITEVDGCDELYRPRSAIADTEARYARLYKSDASLLCAGGSTLCIQTMLALALKPGDKLICGRDCHASAVNTMALLDIDPCWVYPETDKATGLAKAITAAQIKTALEENPDAKAVYITSPDYFGRIAGISAISDVCREFSVPLLVDNAHGAHLRFLNPSQHPINLGAAMCNDSLHKTLPVLTGGAVLHIKNPRFIADSKRCMSIFGSTSPSYLIMLSIDRALDTLCGDFSGKLQAVSSKIAELEKLAENKGFAIPTGARDPARLTLGFGAVGYDSGEFSLLLRQSGIEPEMITESFCVLMASPFNTGEDFELLQKFIENLRAKPPMPVQPTEIIRPKCKLSLREAIFSPVMEVPLENAAGKIAGATVSPCPPGIPLVTPGELIDENLLRVLKKYGISRLNVLK